jgi:HlyD family secretion protein
MRRALFIGGGVVLALGVAGWLIFGGGKVAPAGQVGQVLRTTTVTRGDLDLTVSANGVVQPINKIEIRSKASGQIEEMNFVEGQRVENGELLIALDQRTTKQEYDQTQSDLALAEARLQAQENNFRRSKELFDKGLISEQERDQANVDYVSAKTQLIRARASLSLAEERLRETRIQAPASGIILSKSVELGQIISSAVSNVGGGTLLGTLADMGEVHVETNVDEVDIGKVRVGQSARVTADAYPEDSFTGEVIRIAPLGKTQQNVTTFSVLIKVQNVSMRLKAGMSASVDIEIFRRQGVLLIANEALKDPETEEGRALLAALRPADSTSGLGRDSAARGGMPGSKEPEIDPRAMREMMMNATPEERERLQKQFREQAEKRMAAMSPEERDRFARMRRQRTPGGGGPSGGGVTIAGGSGEGGMVFFGMMGSGPRQKRTSQVTQEDVVRERIVEVQRGDTTVPQLVKIGASNFDHSEVLAGLREGDVVRYATISRAKVVAEQMNERMRSMSGISGMTGGTTRGAGGGGR